MSKKHNNNKVYIVLSVCSILAVSITYNYFKNIQVKELRSMAKAQKKAKKTIVNNIAKSVDQSITKSSKRVARGIASVPKPALLSKYQNRKIVGHYDKDKDIPISNSVNKAWKDLATDRLEGMLKSEIELEIRPVESLVFVQHKMGRYVEHVKVVLKDKTGLSSAYDAYIDSQSGKIIRTWNRTKFEIKPTAFVQSRGNEFVAEPLNIQKPKTSL